MLIAVSWTDQFQRTRNSWSCTLLDQTPAGLETDPARTKAVTMTAEVRLRPERAHVRDNAITTVIFDRGDLSLLCCIADCGAPSAATAAWRHRKL